MAVPTGTCHKKPACALWGGVNTRTGDPELRGAGWRAGTPQGPTPRGLASSTILSLAQRQPTAGRGASVTS